jgi:ADP-ribosyl-[dinitrogen reductase] hydrolase
MTTREDRIKGVLLGQAAGDALGSHYEFGKPSKGHAEMLKGTFGHAPGEWTDDTQQAICVAACRSSASFTAAALIGWYDGGPLDVGSQTSVVMSNAGPRGTAGRPARMLEASKAYAAKQARISRPAHWDPGSGNGSLMRTGPVCLPFPGDRERIAEAARAVSDLTHADEWAGDACVLWSLAIDEAIGLGREWTAARMRVLLKYIPVGRRDYWQKQIDLAMTSDPATFSPNGSAAACFRAALSAVAHSTSLEDGLQLAVSIGNDTDTVAAVAGALLGAIHGASAVPAAWRAKLHGWPGMTADDLGDLAIAAAGV